MKPILYSFRRCPYAMRARLAISIAEIDLEIREVVLSNKPAEMLQASPKGTVPVLVLADGRVIDESLDIIYWALGSDIYDVDQQRLVFDNDGAFKYALDRYKYYSRQELQEPGRSALDYRSEALIHLNKLDNYLVLNCAADTLYFTIAVLPFVRQFRGVEPAWFDSLPFRQLHKSLAALVESSLFGGVMRKYPVWQSGQQGFATQNRKRMES